MIVKGFVPSSGCPLLQLNMPVNFPWLHKNLNNLKMVYNYDIKCYINLKLSNLIDSTGVKDLGITKLRQCLPFDSLVSMNMTVVLKHHSFNIRRIF